MKDRIIRNVAALAFSLSAVSWAWRFIDDYIRWSDLWFYVLVPLIAWLLFFGPLLMLGNERKGLRITGAILLAPGGLLWVLSVLIGFYGLRIH